MSDCTVVKYYDAPSGVIIIRNEDGDITTVAAVIANSRVQTAEYPCQSGLQCGFSETVKHYMEEDTVTDESDFPERSEDISGRFRSDGFPDRPDGFESNRSFKDGFPEPSEA